KGDPHEPGTYGFLLEQAHPSIAAFGGMFLLLLFLNFVLDPERESTWLSWVEKPLLRMGRLDQLPTVVAGVALLLASEFLVDADVRSTVLFSGLLGIVLYIGVNGLAAAMEEQEAAKEEELAAGSGGAGSQVLLAGKAAFSLFLFLEV